MIDLLWKFATVGLPILCSLVAIFLAVRAERRASRALEIQQSRETDRKLAQKQADLIAEIRWVPNGVFGQYYLRIENIGKADAENFALTMDGLRFTDHPMLKDLNEKEIHFIRASTGISYGLFVSNGKFESSTGDQVSYFGTHDLELTFSDESEQQRKSQQTVRVSKGGA